MNMNVVGIDVSKGKSMVAVLRPFGELVTKPENVLHTSTQLSQLVERLKSLEGETKVVMEHTGRYYEPVAQTLHDAGLFVSTVNPLLIKEYGGNSLRKVKTDKADSLKIARYGLDNWAELREHSDMDTKRYQLKTLNRQFGLYSKNKIALKNNLIALLDQTYPNVNNLFDSHARSNGSQKWVDFAETFWHVDLVRKISQNAFTEKYRKFCKKHGYNFKESKTIEIYTIAKELLPTMPKNNLSKIMMKGAISQLNAVSKTVELFRTQMDELAKQLPEYDIVMQMYGVGSSLGPQIMAEIGDVTKFAHKGSLTAFAGVDPSPNQSGTKDVRSNKSSKRGSPQLRKSLFIVMTVLLQNAPPDDPVYQFIDKKRSEGKPYYDYMTAGCNKFLRIYYGRVKEYLATRENT